MSAIVLLLALLPLSYYMRAQWFGPKPFMGQFGMRSHFENPQSPFKSYGLLVRALKPALATNFDGTPWLPTTVPKRLGSVRDLSAIVSLREDRTIIQFAAEVPGVSAAIADEYQWYGALNDVPIFSVEQWALDRRSAVGEVLMMRLAPDEPVPAARMVGSIRLNGTIASVTYQPLMDTEDIRWSKESWSVRVTGPSARTDDVRRLAVQVSNAIDRLALPHGVGLARFWVDSPSDKGQLNWATSDGLMSAGSQIDPFVAIDVAELMAPMQRLR